MKIHHFSIFVFLVTSRSFSQDISTPEGRIGIEHHTHYWRDSTKKLIVGHTGLFSILGKQFSVASPAVSRNEAYSGCDSGIVYSISPSIIRVICKFIAAGSIEGAPAISNDTIFVGFKNNLFPAFSITDGNLLWKYETNGPVVTTPIIHDKFVYFTTSNGYCYSLKTETGEFKWRFNVPSAASSPIYDQRISFDKDVIKVGNDRQRIYAINAKNGDEEWHHDGAGGQPLVNELRVFAKSFEGTVSSIDKITGHRDWWLKGDLVPGTTEFALSSNTLVFGNGSRILATDSDSGEGFKWERAPPSALTDPPIMIGDVFYAPSGDKKNSPLISEQERNTTLSIPTSTRIRQLLLAPVIS